MGILSVEVFRGVYFSDNEMFCFHICSDALGGKVTRQLAVLCKV